MTKFLKTIKYFLIISISVFLVSLGINAGDKFGNISQSLVGKIFFKDDGLCPPDMVFVPMSEGGFCIDKYEASAGDKCKHLDVDSQTDTRENLSDIDCRPVSEKGKIPWRFISQIQASEACRKAGKRLPTNKEWLATALGTTDKDANWTQDDCQVQNNWAEQPGKTGTAKLCVSASGAYDMIGNVWEWVDGVVSNGIFEGELLPKEGYIVETDTNGLVRKTDKNQADKNYYNDYFWIKNKGIRGIARGGYWDNGEKAGQYSMYLVPPPSFAGAGVGFRCVK